MLELEVATPIESPLCRDCINETPLDTSPTANKVVPTFSKNAVFCKIRERAPVEPFPPQAVEYHCWLVPCHAPKHKPEAQDALELAKSSMVVMVST